MIAIEDPNYEFEEQIRSYLNTHGVKHLFPPSTSSTTPQIRFDSVYVWKRRIGCFTVSSAVCILFYIYFFLFSYFLLFRALTSLSISHVRLILYGMKALLPMFRGNTALWTLLVEAKKDSCFDLSFTVPDEQFYLFADLPELSNLTFYPIFR